MRTRQTPWVKLLWIMLPLTGLTVMPAQSQNLRYDNHREVAIPEYATFQLGPFNSSWAISLTTGYRWVETSGTGSDFLFSGSRGQLKEDGSDFPVILGLDTRNYLIIGPHTDLDISVSFRYEYYPLDTQDSEFRIFLPGEGLTANLAMEMQPAPYLRMRPWDAFAWQTDYLDTRGLDDRYGGRRQEYIRNTIGLDGDLLLAERQNLGFGVARTDHWTLDDVWSNQTYVTHSGQLLYQYQVAEYVTAGLMAGLAKTEYPESDRPGVLINEYRAELATRVTERTTANVFVGYALGSIDAYAGRGTEHVNSMLYGGGLRTELSPRLTHGILYAHGLQAGYAAGLEEFDLLRYDIGWTGEFAKWSAYTGLQVRDPSSTNLNGYTDWTSGVVGEVPIMPYLSLVGAVRYSERSNDSADLASLDPEETADYTTWAIKAGPVLRLSDEFRLEAYVEHIERNSDNSQLDYTRDIAAILLTYRHEL